MPDEVAPDTENGGFPEQRAICQKANTARVNKLHPTGVEPVTLGSEVSEFRLGFQHISCAQLELIIANEMLGTNRLRFTDDQRRRLAAKAKEVA